jgi:plastocyanin
MALVVVVVFAAVLWACGGSSSSGSSTSTNGNAGSVAPPAGSGPSSGSEPGSFYGPATKVEASEATVDVVDNDFEPKNLEVKAGTKITFDATGHNQHDIVPDDPKKFDFTVPQEKLPPGSKVSFTFSTPGTYYYYCSLHATATAGDMRGVITVEP